MKLRYKLYILSIIILFIGTNANSQVLETKSLPEERNYEIVIVKGISIPIFDGVPVDQLYLYAFYNNEGWKPIPFQIDESDPTYADPPDNKFDSNDELLFLAQDLGDKVTLGNWIDNEDAKSNKRIEIEIVDPIDENNKGWCYFYKSATLTESDKSDIKYLTYDAVNDSVVGRYYHAGYGNNWFPRNISITAEGQGNGKDFYDRTKFRIRAIPFPGIDLFLNENHLLLSSKEYLIEGPIRIQRRDTLKFNIPDFEFSATFTRKFSPYFTNFHGKVELQAQWLFKVLRMSYDLSPDIAGAKFFSGDSNRVKNTNITVDGSSDKSSINLGLQKNSPNWTMVTGQFGTMLTINSVNFEKDTTYTEPYTQELYYWDDNTGAPLPIGMDTDTGDSVSYGDHGMIFKSDALVGVATYNSETYLLPANKASDCAQKMFYNFNSPMFFRIDSQDFLTGVELAGNNHIPTEFRLRPNFPNPFNPTTNITFDLPKNDFVTLEIFDLQGRHIITLVNNKLNAGVHNYTWNGRDQNDHLVTSGIYLCTIKTGTFSATQKMAFVK
jgi:hypothetical protein